MCLAHVLTLSLEGASILIPLIIVSFCADVGIKFDPDQIAFLSASINKRGH